MQFRVFDLGLIDFKKAWEFQRETFEEVKSGSIESALILCRHYPVITLGRSALRENIRIHGDELKKRGIEVYEVERAGDVTYHGPGQIIAYPVFNLTCLKKDIHLFLRQLEEVAIDFLAEWGIRGVRYTGLTGVWVGNRKIASVGLAIRHWISFHGLSINIKKDDLDNWLFIRPCGMDIEMASLETVLGQEVQINSAKESLIHRFKDVFNIDSSLLSIRRN